MTKDPINILLVDDQPAKLLSYEATLQSLGENMIKAGSANRPEDYARRKKNKMQPLYKGTLDAQREAQRSKLELEKQPKDDGNNWKAPWLPSEASQVPAQDFNSLRNSWLSGKLAVVLASCNSNIANAGHSSHSARNIPIFGTCATAGVKATGD